MAADDRLPDRLRNETRVMAGEEQVRRATEEAIRVLLRTLRSHLRSNGTVDTAIMDNRMPAWRDAVERMVMPTIEDVFGKGYRQVLNQGDFNADPATTRYLDSVRNRLVRTADEAFRVIGEEINLG